MDGHLFCIGFVLMKPRPKPVAPSHPQTPDGRYMVVRGRLWRLSNPMLDATTRQQWVNQLMSARRAVRLAGADAAQIAQARVLVHEAKCALGERGPIWWTDGAPDYNRHTVVNTPYAAWFKAYQRENT